MIDVNKLTNEIEDDDIRNRRLNPKLNEVEALKVLTNMYTEDEQCDGVNMEVGGDLRDGKIFIKIFDGDAKDLIDCELSKKQARDFAREILIICSE